MKLGPEFYQMKKQVTATEYASVAPALQGNYQMTPQGSYQLQPLIAAVVENHNEFMGNYQQLSTEYSQLKNQQTTTPPQEAPKIEAQVQSQSSLFSTKEMEAAAQPQLQPQPQPQPQPQQGQEAQSSLFNKDQADNQAQDLLKQLQEAQSKISQLQKQQEEVTLSQSLTDMYLQAGGRAEMAEFLVPQLLKSVKTVEGSDGSKQLVPVDNMGNAIKNEATQSYAKVPDMIAGLKDSPKHKEFFTAPVQSGTISQDVVNFQPRRPGVPQEPVNPKQMQQDIRNSGVLSAIMGQSAG